MDSSEMQSDDTVSRQLLDVASELRLEVRSLVLVDDVALGELVKHLLDEWELLLGIGLVCSSTETTHSDTHVASVVAIVQTTLLLLTDSL